MDLVDRMEDEFMERLSSFKAGAMKYCAANTVSSHCPPSIWNSWISYPYHLDRDFQLHCNVLLCVNWDSRSKNHLTNVVCHQTSSVSRHRLKLDASYDPPCQYEPERVPESRHYTTRSRKETTYALRLSTDSLTASIRLNKLCDSSATIHDHDVPAFWVGRDASLACGFRRQGFHHLIPHPQGHVSRPG